MPALIVIGAILLFFIFLLSLKATVTVAYSGEAELFVRVLFVKIRILPKKEKKYPHSMSARKAQRLKKKRLKKLRKKLEKKRGKQEEKEQKKRDVASGKAESKKKTPREILDIISLVCSLVTKVVKTFFKHLRIKLVRINLKIATDDAATTAVTYGAVSQTLNILFNLLDGVKTVKLPKTEEINVYPDFCSEDTEIDLKFEFSLRVWHLLHVAAVALARVIKYFFEQAKKNDESDSSDSNGDSESNDGKSGNGGNKNQSKNAVTVKEPPSKRKIEN